MENNLITLTEERINILKSINSQLNFMSIMGMDEVVSYIEEDHDGNKHLMFKHKDDEDMSCKTFRELYDNTYLTGNVCLERSRKTNEKLRHLDVTEKEAGVTTMTVCSVIAMRTFNCDALFTLSYLLGWLYK